MTKTLRCALGALIAAACGGGDDGDDPTPDGSDDVVCGDGTCAEGQEDVSTCPDDCITSPNCGDGVCGSDESCGLCPADCGACTPTCGDRTCNGDETCASCTNDCGCGVDQMCSENACVVQNPLFVALTGRWNLVELNGAPPDSPNTSDVTVDPTVPGCDYPDQVPGDACVLGFQPIGAVIIAGTRLYLDTPEFQIEGEVLEDDQRIEDTLVIHEDPPRTYMQVWEKK